MASAQPLTVNQYDAVVVVPGIMGSCLADINTGEQVWGFKKLHHFTDFWYSSPPSNDSASVLAKQTGRPPAISWPTASL